MQIAKNALIKLLAHSVKLNSLFSQIQPRAIKNATVHLILILFLDCNHNGDNKEFYSDCGSCEVDPSTLEVISCKSCMNGYFDGTGCVSQCPRGKYGKAVFAERGIILEANCESKETSNENNRL